MSKNKEKSKRQRASQSPLQQQICFAAVCNFSFWYMDMGVNRKSPEVEVTISSVPVKIDMDNSVPAQLNLQIFGDNNYTVDITVKGKNLLCRHLPQTIFPLWRRPITLIRRAKRVCSLKLRPPNRIILI